MVTLVRSAQLAGALSAVAERTLHYAQERHQFGKPLAAFQAVQEHLVTVVQAASMSVLAVERAGRAAQGRQASFEIAAAGVVVAEQAARGSRAAHQAHGAIGMTREYPLQLLTRRLAQWRHDLGDAREIAGALGRAAAAVPSLRGLVAAAGTTTEVRW
jgi:acyl-CoA dehydrogenase